jgi:CheY-like chemotaxis protein
VSTRASMRRILVIDDSESIHRDFHRLLVQAPRRGRDDIAEMEEVLFGEGSFSHPPTPEPIFEVDSAFQGQEGVLMVQKALEDGRPYELVFLDYRMPPGWNGVQTLRQLRKVAPSLRVVLCSAYSDYSWQEILEEFGQPELLAQLKKPFNSHQLRSMLHTLTT